MWWGDWKPLNSRNTFCIYKRAKTKGASEVVALRNFSSQDNLVNHLEIFLNANFIA